MNQPLTAEQLIVGGKYVRNPEILTYTGFIYKHTEAIFTRDDLSTTPVDPSDVIPYEEQPADSTSESKAWLFQGTNELKHPITIYISAVDRESAIAHFETDYPQYKWFATIPCPVLC